MNKQLIAHGLIFLQVEHITLESSGLFNLLVEPQWQQQLGYDPTM